MFSKRSIRRRFLFQLIVASAALVVLFSSFLYLFIKQSIYDEKQTELVTRAQSISTSKSLTSLQHIDTDPLSELKVDLITLKKDEGSLEFSEVTDQDQITTLTLIYPFDFEHSTYLKISRDISATKLLLQKILQSIFIINAFGFIVIILYAIAFSKMLIAPVSALTKRLADMNEHLLRPIKVDQLPNEFQPLGETLNRLMGRIQNFVKYQKELFIGTAHELKTPLAVIKLKNQVTLIKKRSAEEYIEAIKITNQSVDEMNKIVSDILNIGRQEGAQLEMPVEADIIQILKKWEGDFALLTHSENKIFKTHFEPETFTAVLQVTLLNQILQNFLQNAMKFTAPGKTILFHSYLHNTDIIIEVIDEGCGVDEAIDLFAPFKRQGNKSGAGLGLFLAKSAAEAIGADITITNRIDGIDGTIARLVLPAKLYCLLPQRK
ncbi:MAG TPA: HAMP domain-containing sensor histidine kinase [Sulfuricurvum sp.]|nr:MAG: two-component sensor histidine kinase [Campylobacterales bacterium 16-40-21]OZA03054.1 MAG: two-component sensor histidine kinase [Sulfuricurvum sp. 17-40-25]HQS66861.1 HAMP domain-containing sensor histidine kinase [Sulfuricurvum sp.]HQT35599.1 HAMP domain-containing sensor histidine kinase [Sulfuricurvum sp.]